MHQRQIPLRMLPSGECAKSPVDNRKQARSRLYLSLAPGVTGDFSSGERAWSIVGQSSLASAAFAASPFCLESLGTD